MTNNIYKRHTNLVPIKERQCIDCFYYGFPTSHSAINSLTGRQGHTHGVCTISGVDAIKCDVGNFEVQESYGINYLRGVAIDIQRVALCKIMNLKVTHPL